MAIVCCNLLLGYTLIKSNATDEIAKVFYLSGDGEEMHTQWDNAYAEIAAHPEKIYKVVLLNDWQLQKQLTLAQGNLIFDLAGCTVDGSYGGGFIVQDANGNCALEITDSDSAQRGMITNFQTSIITSTTDTTANPTATLKISGGRFTKNYAPNADGTSTAGLVSTYANTEIAGGIFTENHCFIMIRVAGAEASSVKLTLSGGVIVNNDCDRFAVYTDSRCTLMTGGKIANNTFDAPAKYAAFRTYNGFTMTGGEIYNNTNKNVEASEQTAQVSTEWVQAIIKISGGTIIATTTGQAVMTNRDTVIPEISSNANVFKGAVSNLTLINNVNEYKVGDKVDLAVIAEFSGTYDGQAKTVNINLLPEEYSITYPNGDSLQKGNNTVVVTYGEKIATLPIYVAEETPDEPEPVDPTPDEPAQPDIGDGEDDNDQPENPDDGEDVETPDDNDNQTPTTPDDDNQPTPEAPKAETPNNTPWIMLFVGIGVGAVLLVGGITLGVVLSKRKNK